MTNILILSNVIAVNHRSEQRFIWEKIKYKGNKVRTQQKINQLCQGLVQSMPVFQSIRPVPLNLCGINLSS